MQSHRKRPAFLPRIPALVTLRAVGAVASFRQQLLGGVIWREIRRASTQGLRVVHFSIQSNHLHLIVEADDQLALSRGMQRLSSRVARHLNWVLGRVGSLWRDRYHRRDLSTPRQYRNALVYTVFNIRKHSDPVEGERERHRLDAFSSSIWIDEWDDERVVQIARSARSRAGPPPVVPPKSWTARFAWWFHHGKLHGTECPKASLR